jgi:hypothetical protein
VGTSDGDAAVPVNLGDRPGVAVGDVEAAVVAAGRDAIADPDALPCRGGGVLVVDPAGGDEPVADGRVEVGGLLASVRHDGHRPIIG